MPVTEANTGRRYTKSRKYWFDIAAANAAVAFYETRLKLTKLEFAGRPFILSRRQKRRVRKIFGWKRADGTRRYRRVWVEEPRGNGKTEWAAGTALCVWMGDGDHGADFYSLASEEGQARIVFERAGQMVAADEGLASAIEPFKTALWCAATNSGFKPLSSAPKSKQGFRPKGFIGDEVHVWDNGELAETVHEGEGVTAQPLDIYITTAGEVGTYAHEQHLYALQVLRCEIEDDELFVDIASAGDDEDWTDPAVWKRANPNYGVSVRPDFLASECKKARALPRLENRFRRFYLNQWVAQSTRWLPMEFWDMNTAAPSERAKALFLSDPDRGETLLHSASASGIHDPDLWKHLPGMLKGRVCAGGLDLATVRDLCAFALMFPPLNPQNRETILWKFYLPRDTLKTLKAADRARYESWAKMGALTLTPGNVADYSFIKADILSASKTYRLTALGIDRWNATQLAVELENTEGLPVELFGQGFASMSGPSKEYERLVMGLSLEHGNHPVARWMADNVAVDTDPHDNIKPTKDRSSGKIDGQVAAIMAKGMLMAKPLVHSVYETRGLRRL